MDNRRSFLRQLAGLPLIGGSVAIVGRPSAVAEPVTAPMLEAYKTWLHYETRFLCWEMANDEFFLRNYYAHLAKAPVKERWERIGSQFAYIGDAGSFHHIGDKPSSRAALVLSAVGCNWHDDNVERLDRDIRIKAGVAI